MKITLRENGLNKEEMLKNRIQELIDKHILKDNSNLKEVYNDLLRQGLPQKFVADGMKEKINSLQVESQIKNVELSWIQITFFKRNDLEQELNIYHLDKEVLRRLPFMTSDEFNTFLIERYKYSKEPVNLKYLLSKTKTVAIFISMDGNIELNFFFRPGDNNLLLMNKNSKLLFNPVNRTILSWIDFMREIEGLSFDEKLYTLLMDKM